MNEEEQIRAQVARTVEEFQQLEIFQTFLRLKEEIAASSELFNLEEQIKIGKKKIKDLRDRPEELAQRLKELKHLEKQYDNHPLIINFKAYQAELADLVDPLIHLFKE